LKIPHDHQFEPVGIASKAEIASRFRNSGYRLCEYSFAIQVCWHNFNDSCWTVIDDWLFLRYRENNHLRFICPVGKGDLNEAIEACFDYLRSHGHPPIIRFVPDEQARLLDRSRFSLVQDSNNSDYMYKTSDLASFAGKKYSKKRNQIAQFMRAGDWSVEPVTSQQRQAINEFLKRWCKERECEGHEVLEHEMHALATCLDNIEALDLSGIVLKGAQGEIIGLSIGGQLTKDTWVTHFEKAMTCRPGSYLVLTRECARRIPKEIQWVDREQDMGEPNLRKAKEQLMPDHMSLSWAVVPG
jgi:hypothetical protein